MFLFSKRRTSRPRTASRPSRLRLSLEILEARTLPSGNALGDSLLGASHVYEFDAGLNDSLGGPALVGHGGAVQDGRYEFGANQGLTLTGALADPLEYSILLSLKLVPNTPGTTSSIYNKIIDFADGTRDSGLYRYGNVLQLYPGAAGTGVVSPHEDFQAVLTRDGASGETRLYLDGVLQQTYTGGSSRSAAAASNILKFVMDDQVTGGREAASGSIERIALYNRALTADEVSVLAAGDSQSPPAGETPVGTPGGSLGDVIPPSPAVQPVPSGDDHGNDPASASAIPPQNLFESFTSGSLERPGDEDWFRFQTRETFGLVGALAIHAVPGLSLSLFNSDGQMLTPARGNAAPSGPAFPVNVLVFAPGVPLSFRSMAGLQTTRFDFGAGPAGTYYLRVTASGSATGDYAFALEGGQFLGELVKSPTDSPGVNGGARPQVTTLTPLQPGASNLVPVVTTGENQSSFGPESGSVAANLGDPSELPSATTGIVTVIPAGPPSVGSSLAATAPSFAAPEAGAPSSGDAPSTFSPVPSLGAPASSAVATAPSSAVASGSPGPSETRGGAASGLDAPSAFPSASTASVSPSTTVAVPSSSAAPGSPSAADAASSGRDAAVPQNLGNSVPTAPSVATVSPAPRAAAEVAAAEGREAPTLSLRDAVALGLIAPGAALPTAGSATVSLYPTVGAPGPAQADTPLSAQASFAAVAAGQLATEFAALEPAFELPPVESPAARLIVGLDAIDAPPPPFPVPPAPAPAGVSVENMQVAFARVFLAARFLIPYASSTPSETTPSPAEDDMPGLPEEMFDPERDALAMSREADETSSPAALVALFAGFAARGSEERKRAVGMTRG